jgi:hypothetical protein
LSAFIRVIGGLKKKETGGVDGTILNS